MSDRVIERVSTRLTLVDFTGPSHGGWIIELKKTSDTWIEQSIPSLANIQVALEEEPSRYAVIIYPDPVERLAGALLEGEEPEEALIGWQNFAASLLELHEKFWDRISLGPRPTSRVGLENLIDHVAKSTGLPLEVPSDSEPSMLTPVEHEEVETYGLRLAAMQLLDLRRPKVLGERLEAVSVRTRDKPYRPDVISAFLNTRKKLLEDRTEYVNLIARHRDQTRKLDGSNKENTLLISQLHRTQEELESALLEQRSMTTRDREMREGQDSHKSTILKLERELQKLNEKLEWLRAVRDQHRSSARDLRVEQKHSRADIRTLEKKVETLSAELRSIKGSRSWRYTRVLRQINGGASWIRN